jgi:hypothetical protein
MEQRRLAELEAALEDARAKIKANNAEYAEAIKAEQARVAQLRAALSDAETATKTAEASLIAEHAEHDAASRQRDKQHALDVERLRAERDALAKAKAKIGSEEAELVSNKARYRLALTRYRLALTVAVLGAALLVAGFLYITY